MKKVISTLFFLMLLFALGGCGNATTKSAPQDVSEPTQIQSEEKPNSEQTGTKAKDSETHPSVSEPDMGNKTLVVYFSATGTTEPLADQEQNDPNARPAISGSIENMDEYDTLILGYPKM